MTIDPEGRKVVDDEGVVMGALDPDMGPLPLVTGLAAEGGTVDYAGAVETVKQVRDAALAAGFGWPGPFPLLDLSRKGAPIAFYRGAVPVQLGGGPYRESLARFAAVLPDMGEEFLASVLYFDLRFRERVVVGTKPPGEGADAETEVRDNG